MSSPTPPTPLAKRFSQNVTPTFFYEPLFVFVLLTLVHVYMPAPANYAVPLLLYAAVCVRIYVQLLTSQTMASIMLRLVKHLGDKVGTDEALRVMTTPDVV